MLRHDVSPKRCGITINLDLEITGAMTCIERAEQGNQRINNSLPSAQPWKIETKLFSSRPKIKHAIFRERGRQRIAISMIETEREAIQRVRCFKRSAVSRARSILIGSIVGGGLAVANSQMERGVGINGKFVTHRVIRLS